MSKGRKVPIKEPLTAAYIFHFLNNFIAPSIPVQAIFNPKKQPTIPDIKPTIGPNLLPANIIPTIDRADITIIQPTIILIMKSLNI